MTIDEKIDLVLSDFYKSRTISVPDYIYFKFGDSNDLANRKECDLLIEMMCVNNLISSLNDYNYTIQVQGVNIYEQGGWSNYKTHLRSENVKNEEIKAKEIEKLFWEARLIKWQVKSFWPLFITAILGALMGAISLIWQIIDKG